MNAITLLAKLKELGIGIRLDNDQLKISAPKEKLTPELLNEIKEKKESIIAFFHNTHSQGDFSPIYPGEEKEYYVLSSSQKRMYILQQLDLDSTVYNMPQVWGFEETLDMEKLDQAFKELIGRHESFRTSFLRVNEEPVQRVHRDADFKTLYYNIKAADNRSGERSSPNYNYSTESVIKDFVRPFDLFKPPLLRVGIIEMGHPSQEWKYIILVDMHHIISDGKSMQILVKEFWSLYGGKELPALRIQYKDFSLWQNDDLVKKKIDNQAAYWLGEFAGEIPVLNLPADYPRPSIQSFEGGKLRFELCRENCTRLNQLALDFDVTLFMVLTALFTLTLSKLSGQEDIVIGTPTAGRRHADLEHVIGMFVNTLPLRNGLRSSMKFSEYLQEVKSKTLKAFENQEYPFEDLVEKVDVVRDVSRNPLFDVMFILQNIGDGSRVRGGVNFLVDTGIMDNVRFDNPVSRFDMTWSAVQSEGRIYWGIEYCTRLFKQQTIQGYTQHFKTLMDEVLADPVARLGDLDILSADERDRILNTFNDTRKAYPINVTVHEVFSHKAEDVLGHTALCREDQCITYGELHKQTDRLALLLMERGVQPETPVGLRVNRSLEMVLGVLGILKAGGAYVPLDVGFPKERVLHILTDSQVRLLLSHSDQAPGLEYDGQVIFLDEMVPRRLETGKCGIVSRPSDLIYIIYTSGSTGRPKGILISHTSVVNILHHLEELYPIDPGGSYLLKTNYTFDVSVTELFGWFFGRGRLVILEPGGEKDPAEIIKTVEKFAVTHINFVPSMLQVFLEVASVEGGDRLQGLRYILVAGEAFSKALASQLSSLDIGAQVENIYGPTEAAIYTTRYSLSALENQSMVPIGCPMNNISTYIVSSDNTLLPVNVWGELCIGGVGLARGYLNRPELTAERFVGHPILHPKSRIIYRTGDLARWLANGDIEFSGRMDCQVKWRGFRIELGEIESELIQHPNIKEAVVAIREQGSGDKSLIAYLVVRKDLSVSTLSEYLSRRLPEYMIPSHFIKIESMPLSPSGKVDRKVLPAPEIGETEVHTAPRSRDEKKIAKLWADVLGIPENNIDIDANFFKLGGHSLKAIKLLARIHKEFNVSLPLAAIFRQSTINGLASYIRGAVKDRHIRIKPVELKEYYRLSSAQKRLYILQQMEKDSMVYNMPLVTKIVGVNSSANLENVFLALIQRHESFRTSFMRVKEEVVQRIYKELDFKIKYYDLTANYLKAGEIPSLHASESIIKHFVRPFDLSIVPLLRVGLIRIHPSPEETYILMVDMHHIIGDGRSMQVLMSEFRALNSGELLPRLRLQYKDYAQWQNGEAIQKKIKKQEDFWLQQFSDEVPVLEVPIDFSRPTVQSFEGSTADFRIGEKETSGLKRLSLEYGSTLYITLLTVVNILLSKLSGQEDIVIGTPVEGRGHADLDGLIGMFVNTLALRNYPLSDKTVIDFLIDVKTTTLRAFDNQEYQFEDLVEKVDVRRDAGRNPLFDVLLAWQEIGGNVDRGTGQTVNLYKGRVSRFDMTWHAVDKGSRVGLVIEYCTKLFKQETIKRFVGYFNRIICSMLTKPRIRLSEIEVLSTQEKSQILRDLSDKDARYPGDKTIYRMFTDQVEKRPDSIALVFENKKLTYGELEARAGRLADRLKLRGVTVGSIVALMLERSFSMIIDLLAVLKSGGGYLPIDPNYPRDRIDYMLNDSGASVVLTKSANSHSFQEINDIQDTECLIQEKVSITDCESRIMNRESRSSNMAYVIYTSGTTGNPKGVLVEHGHVIRLLFNDRCLFDFACTDVWTLFHSYCFDFSVWEMYGALLYGGVLVLISRDVTRDPLLFLIVLQRERVSVLNQTPSAFYNLSESVLRKGRVKLDLRYVIFGGEALKPLKLGGWRRQYPEVRLINMYGITETTVHVTFKEIGDGEIASGVSNIGGPIPTLTCYVMDKDMKLSPIGVLGELYVGGAGVSRGYLNRPELTVDRFVLNPYQVLERLYRSGDLVRINTAGELEYLGRVDHQVQLRGFRVELGEIESRLLSHREVGEAVVLLRETTDEDKYLTAYWVRSSLDVGGTDIEASEFKAYLSDTLPHYMIPSYFVELDKIPLTANGKVNHKALPEPEVGLSSDHTAPRSMIEDRLADIWSEVLSIEKDMIGTEANFFESGGHSLKATVLTGRIQQEFDVVIPLAEVFGTPTIKGMAAYISRTVADRYTPIKCSELKEYYRLSSAQRRLFILQQLESDSTVYNMPQVVRLTGEVSKDKLWQVIKKLIKRHESIRTSFVKLDIEPVQRIHPNVNFEIKYFDITPEFSTSVSDFVQPFDLSKPPLLRVGLARYPSQEENYMLMMDMHHIISDGLSMKILVDEFQTLYASKDLPELHFQYKDYAQWQNSEAVREETTNQERFWLGEFSGEIPVLHLPYDYPRPLVQSFEGSHFVFEMGERETTALKQRIMGQELTMYMALLAVFNILLSKLSGQDDIIVGTPVAGRRHPDLQSIIGLFVNTLALRTHPTGDMTLEDFLGVIREKTLTAFENQEYPFEELVERVNVKRDIAQNPLFNVMFSLLEYNKSVSSPLTGQPAWTDNQDTDKFDNRISKFDLSLDVGVGEKLYFSFEYCTKLFRRETIVRFAGYFERILGALIHDVRQKIFEINILADDEKRRILHDFNDTDCRYSKKKMWPEIFEHQVKQTPDCIALVGAPSHTTMSDEIHQLTYKELHSRSSQLTSTLRHHGILPDVPVGIMIDRSPEMIIGMLGVLKAGGGYLPVDTKYPLERKRYIIKESGIKLLLVGNRSNVLPGIDFSGEIIELDRKRIFEGHVTCEKAITTSENFAYIIYTSGTTGRPKGVMVNHGNLLAYIFAFQQEFKLNSTDFVLQQASFSFDAFVEEVYPILSRGGKVCMARSHEVMDLRLLVEFILKHHITVISCSPLLLNELNRQNLLKSVHTVISGGDVLLGDFVDGFLKTARVYNTYGPTETTVCVTYHKLTDKAVVNVPIGSPISNYQVRILDKKGKLLPMGVPGEIWVSGDGISRGYLNEPEKTAEKFVNLSAAGHSWYRTGDRGRWLVDGNIEFLGRIDRQVKIRGYRIELEEIEACLLSKVDIKEAVVIDRQEKDRVSPDSRERYLCGYIVTDYSYSEGFLELRDYLSGRLSDYMIPSYFIKMDKIPLTVHGKVDRRSLPEPEVRLPAEYTAPQDMIEERLADIWSEVLRIEKSVIDVYADFFELGGQSLKATVMTSRIHKEFSVEIPLLEVFKTSTIRKLAAYIKAAAPEQFTPIQAVEEKEYYMLSSAQKRLYILQQMERDNTIYNMPQLVRLSEEAGSSLLEQMFGKLIERHESLRTSFVKVKDEPVQRVHREVDFGIEYFNIAAKDAKRHEIKDFIKPFDLSRPPLLRVGLIETGQSSAEGRYILLVDMHHIIGDGVSMQILVEEFWRLYQKHLLPQLRLQYRDYALWQKSETVKEKIKQQEAYWVKEFADEIPVLNLPTDYPRPAVQSFEGHTLFVEMGEEEAAGLKSLTLEHGVTLYMALLALLTILLSKLSSQEDIVMGSPIAGRGHADLQRIIGMFVNTLALRNYPLREKSFVEFLQEVKDKTLTAFDNQEYQFEDLVEKIAINRDASRNPVFDVMFVLQNTARNADFKPLADGREFSAGDISDYGYQISKFDMTWSMSEWQDGLFISVEYCTRLFKQATIERFFAYFSKIITAVIAEPHIRLSEIEVLSVQEKNRILHDLNATDAEYPKDKTIHRVFTEQVNRRADAVALVLEDRKLTYLELEIRANRLADRLGLKGVASGSIVALMMERSPAMIIGLLAVLKSGGGYLPIDPDSPQERIDYMLSDSSASLVLTESVNGHSLPVINDQQKVSIRNRVSYIRDREPKPSNLAYVIYTSGTTGKPRGVLVEHINVIQLMFNDRYLFNFDNTDVWTLFHSYCFDFSVWEMYGALLYGGILVLISRGVSKDPVLYLRILQNERVSVLNQTPSAFYNLSDAVFRQDQVALNLRYVIFGGEALKPLKLKEWRKHYPQVSLINMYGITETTVHVTFKEIGDDEIATGISNIGGPIPTLTCYIMDGGLKLSPLGVVGELYVGGAGVSRGYLNRPELTAHRFVQNPFKSAERLYRSGDLARLCIGGEMEYLGRIDHQVQLRGFRVELGEIESRLLSHGAVRETVVVLREDFSEDKYLVAYWVRSSLADSDANVTTTEFMAYLSRTLPGYMIPSYFVELEKIPLTANGKVDRRALPKPEVKVSQDYTAPRDMIEEQLAVVWSEVLSIEKDKISTGADFFELGGHSLKATVMTSRIHKELSVELPLLEVFKSPTIRDLATYIKAAAPEQFTSIQVQEQQEYYMLSSAQKRLYILQQMERDNTIYNMPQLVRLSETTDSTRLEQVFRTLIGRHESLRTSFLTIEDEPVQRVHKEVDFEIEFYDNAAAKGREDIIKDFIRPFDLSRPPLLRVGLIKREMYVLLLDMHHIIGDGVSNQILLEEFWALYEERRLPSLRVQYRDYAQWQSSERTRKKIEQQQRFWVKEFGHEVPILELPLDYPRPAVQSFEGHTVFVEIGEEETAGLKTLTLAHGITLYMALLALFTILLSKLSSQEDIVVGSPVAGRGHADLQRIIGMFVNTLALRNYPVGEKRFVEFLQEVKNKALAVFENQEYQFEDLVEQVAVNRDVSRNPVFDVMFVMQNLTNPKNKDSNENTIYDYGNRISKFDMTWNMGEGQDGLLLVVEYCTRLFKQATIERFIAYFKKIIDAVIAEPGVRLAQIAIIPEDDRKQVLYRFNDTKTDYPSGQTIHGLFEEQAASIPYAIAVVSEKECLSYRELSCQSNKLACCLIAEGVGGESAVGILGDRCVETVIGLVAILKAGGVYLPVNVDDPEERKEYLLKDSGAGTLLTAPKIEDKVRKGLNRAADASLSLAARSIEPTNLAYIIYTSGSTGNPKGLMVKHRNVVRLVKNTNYVEFKPGNRILQTGALEFDASTFEIWGSLLNGLTLYLFDKEKILAPARLKRIIENHDIDTVWMTAPLFNQMLTEDIDIFSGLRNLLVGGDVLSPLHINRLRERFSSLNVINGYGPTENTTFSTTFLIDRAYSHSIPIGSPISNSTAYIVDRHHHLQPVGVAGELWVGGDGVGRGYLNDPELTAEKFVKAPTASRIPQATRIYRTGDLARFRPSGVIEFLGRMDFQVKIRGFRIELTEIESRLLDHPGIREAVVTAHSEKKGDKTICAYIVPLPIPKTSPTNETSRTSPLQLREYLSRTLPGYMIPTYFVPMETIPLTPNGKVDRRALPEPAYSEDRTYKAPVNKIEEKLIEIWSALLSIDRDHIGTDANFFELGGHSLKATILSGHLHREFDVEVPLVEIFRIPTIEELSAYIQEASAERFVALEAVESREYYELSSAQRRMYILQQMSPDSTVYNIPQVLKLREAVDRYRLEEVFRKLIVRHESFRTSFMKVGDEPVQRVYKEVDFEIEYYNRAARDVKGREVILSDFVRPFDLSRPPLMRVGLIQGEVNVLVVDMQHIISDGTSMHVLVNEFRALDEGVELPALRIQYKDFSMWQNSESVKEKIRSQEAYWLAEFAGDIPVLNLPADYPRPAIQSFEGGCVNFELGMAESVRLEQLALDSGVTMFMVLTALFSILLSKLGSQEDIVIGTPTAGRRHADLERLIGMFVNTLALRNYPNSGKRFGEFLQEVKSKTLKAFENQEYPFEDLVEKVDVSRDVSRNPLFDVMLVLQNIGDGSGMRVGEEFKSPVSRFDMTWSTVQRGGQLYWGIEYCTRLFKLETIHRYASHFKTVANAVISAGPRVKITQIDILSAEERNRILYAFNDTRKAYPHTSTVHEIFSHRAGDIPDHLAICLNDKSITYGELEKQSDRLALVLIDKGVGRETPVGLWLNRSFEMIIGILGVLKAGGAYMPIDASYPKERVAHILIDSQISLLLVQHDQNPDLQYEGEIFKLEERVSDFTDVVALEMMSNPHDLIYVIYTSGSTGRPKGILINHTNVVNILHHLEELYPVGQDGGYLFKTNYTFDVSVTELFGWFFGGGRLVILEPGGEKDPSAIIDTVEICGVTHINFVPSMLQVFLDVAVTNGRERLATLRYIMVAGEAFSPALAGRLPSPGNVARVENIYGPTEATIYTTRYSLSDFKSMSMVPIGRPMNNMTTYIVGGDGTLLPVNVWGELCIGGIGLARGYLNRPELTADRFLDLAVRSHEEARCSKCHPLSVHKNFILNTQKLKLYKTGDLARFLPDGNIEFHGRMDFQVKLRGFRIELGEIESELLQHPDIKEAVVTLRGDGDDDQYLAAYIVSLSTNKASQTSETNQLKWREYLSKVLPDYMIPSHFVEIESIPLNPAGKVDRKALPEPEIVISETYPAARTELENDLVEIWSEVLGLQDQSLGIDHNFFRIGGHSLKATILVSRIRNQLGVEVPLIEIFKSPTIRQLAACIESYLETVLLSEDEHLVLLRKGTTEAPILFLIHDGTGEVGGYLELCDHFSMDINCWGIRVDWLEDYAPQNWTIEEMAEKYIQKIMKIQAHGPYHMVGWSLGGTIAFEIALQLEKQGERITFLGLIDAPGPGKQVAAAVSEFSVQSEIEWLSGCLPDVPLLEHLKVRPRLDEIWVFLLDYFDQNQGNFKIVKGLIPYDLASTIPNYDQLDHRQIIHYLNLNRTLVRARDLYFPKDKLKTVIHYFKASQSAESFMKNWGNFCIKPIQQYEISGDHFTILRSPKVIKTAQQFNKLLNLKN